MGFPGGSVAKNPLVSILARKIPQTEEPGGYSPQGHKETDTHSHYGERYGGSLKNQKQSYHVTQQFHSWGYSRKNSNSKRYTHPSVHSSSVYNSQDMDATWMSINRGMDKDVVHIYNGMPAIKKNQIVSFAATWMDPQIVVLSDKRQKETNVT